MLSQMDPALVAYCDKIAALGGPMLIPDDLGGSTFPSTPVVQLGTVTRASARLRNVQPEVNLDQSYEALKRPKKNVDSAHTGIQAFNYLSRKLMRYILLILLFGFTFKQTKMPDNRLEWLKKTTDFRLQICLERYLSLLSW